MGKTKKKSVSKISRSVYQTDVNWRRRLHKEALKLIEENHQKELKLIKANDRYYSAIPWISILAIICIAETIVLIAHHHHK